MHREVNVTAKIDKDLREAALEVFQRLGITESESIRLFFEHVKHWQDLSLDAARPDERRPSQETIGAMREGEHPNGLQGYGDFSEIRKAFGVQSFTNKVTQAFDTDIKI